MSNLLDDLDERDADEVEMDNYTYQYDSYISEEDFGEEDEWEDECSHTITCECENCMQTYPERFDDNWENIYRNDWPTMEGPSIASIVDDWESRS